MSRRFFCVQAVAAFARISEIREIEPSADHRLEELELEFEWHDDVAKIRVRWDVILRPTSVTRPVSRKWIRHSGP